jgi:glutamate-1-semialdehyde 2,1-aminomutase
MEALLRPGVYDELEAKAAALAEGLEKAAAKKAPFFLSRVGSLMTAFFHDGPVHDFESAAESDTKAFARFFHGMLERGIYLAPSQFEAAFVSLAHSDEDIARTVDAAADVMASM